MTFKLSEKDDRGAPVAQWIKRLPAKLTVWVRFWAEFEPFNNVSAISDGNAQIKTSVCNEDLFTVR